MSLLGRIRTLVVLRESDHGLYLDAGQLGEVLLALHRLFGEEAPNEGQSTLAIRHGGSRLQAIRRSRRMRSTSGKTR